ncbi:serine/threonine kinase [Aureococcus anophagefferens]|nr:serine/threonine kinase [Aureococcus anophagefferens]
MAFVMKFFRKDPCVENYQLGRVLGQGSFATVKRATDKKDKSVWAVKIIRKKALGPEDQEALEKEVSIMQELSALKHPHIVYLKEVYDSADNFYMVMELCQGGEVFDRIVKKEKYTEVEARDALKQIVEAIRVCHSRGIVHRDLKPENLLYVSPESDEIKLADFGLANILQPNSALATACGTPGYVAPEVIGSAGYNKEVDIWSLGVIAYILLCGFPPFYDENQGKLFKKIQRCQYTFTRPYWDQVSDGAKKMITTMLVVDPAKRATAQGVLDDPWMAADGGAKDAKDAEGARHLDGFRENMARYNARRKFKAGIMSMQIVSFLQNGALHSATLRAKAEKAAEDAAPEAAPKDA